MHSGDGSLLEFAPPIGCLHRIANGVPVALINQGVNATIRDDFDSAVRQQHIDEYSIIVGSIPNSQLREDLDRPGARGVTRQKLREW